MIVFWDEESECFVAEDFARPGCSSIGDSVIEAMREMRDARAAWDEAAAAVRLQ